MLDQLEKFAGGDVLEKFDKIFNSADTSDDNLISYDEWNNGFKALKSEASEAQIKEIFDSDFEHLSIPGYSRDGTSLILL